MLTTLMMSAVAASASPLDDAAMRYNRLSDVTVPVVIGSVPNGGDRGRFVVPAWVKTVTLDPTEAAALVVLTELRENRAERRRNWTAPEYLAGYVAETATGGSKPGYPLPYDPNRGAAPLAADRSAPAASRYERRLGELGSCTGALASALGKLRAAKPDDDFTRFTVRARQRLGLAMLPPDTRCLPNV
jgi:hypothetical protein